jgi:hypothetical protein
MTDNMDLSKYSNEELLKIAQGAQIQKPSISQEEPGFLKNLGQSYLNYAGGALRGMGQAAGDLGASALNAPISGIEYLSGHKIPHVPHPNLINKNPNSLGESVGQILGQLTGGIALPGGAAVKGAQWANRGYQALRSGRELPLIGKLLSGAAGGAAEGALGNEDNRLLGSGLGALLGGTGQGITSAIKLAKGIKSKNIAKDIQNTYKNFESNFEKRFNPSLESGEEAGANKFLKPQKGNVAILKKAGGIDKKSGTKDLTYSLEHYNSNPTLKNAHYAQRDLNKLANIHKYAPEGTAEKKAYDEALKLKNRLLEQISHAFEKSGSVQHGSEYSKARIDYAKEFGPYLKSKAIAGLLGKNASRTATIRPSQFADKLLQEEEFLTQAGHRHPELLQRERAKKIAKNPLATVGLAIGIGMLPYEIRKLLGH